MLNILKGGFRMSIHFSFPEYKEVKIGDKIKINDKKWLRNGQEGVVTEISKRGIYIKFDDTEEPMFFPGHYDIIKS